MPIYQWRDLLERWSDAWLDSVLHEQERFEPFTAEVRAARWLGYAGASSADISALESRLDAVLPPSYRQFLTVSDGWLDTTSEIRRILPTAEVGWARETAPEIIGPWLEGETIDVPDEDYFVYGDEQDSSAVRTEYLSGVLKISHTPDSTDVYFLNPGVVTSDGEWEAWYFAHWLPGAVRYRSFWELMNTEFAKFQGLE